MNLAALDAELADFECDPALAVDPALADRARALDLVDLVLELALRCPDDLVLRALRHRGVDLRARLIDVNQRLFTRLRSEIRAGGLTGSRLRGELAQYTGYVADQQGLAHVGFDGLDVLVDGLLAPLPTRDLDYLAGPDLVHYEPTPARVVLDLVDHVRLAPDDVFYDLGSGVGRVVLLVHLLTGVTAKGIELRSDLCQLARCGATALGAASVTFLQGDARDIDFADGTVFFLFTPFRGQALRAVLDRLRAEARRTPLTVCSYGSCTRCLADESWLRLDEPALNHDRKLAIFHSGRSFFTADRVPGEPSAPEQPARTVSGGS